MDIYNDDFLVSGPFNVVRLENKEMNKVLYLFPDYHMEPIHQTQCDDPKSIHISHFLDKNFRKTKLPLDFFLETSPGYEYKYKLLDVNHLTKLRTDFSKKYENVRKHYIDIRYVTFDMFELRDKIHNLLGSNNPPSHAQYDDIKNMINNITKEHELMNAIIFENEGAIKNIIGDRSANMLKIFIKIHKYTKRPENINKFKVLYDEIERYIDINKKNIKDLIDGLTNLENVYNIDTNILLGSDGKYHVGEYDKIMPIMDKIKKTISDFFINFVNGESFIVDLYFLRRFLEKQYISNAIVYAGGAHIANYILFLVTQYNFKITHIFYNKLGTISKLENKIREIYKAGKNIYGTPGSAGELMINIMEREVFSQCVNFKGFPKKFR